MDLSVEWSEDVVKRFPELAICVGVIKNVSNKRTNSRIEELKRRVIEEVKLSFNVEELKDNPIVRSYRDFYWKLGIDPTKTRPSGEALLRRVLRGKPLPTISTVVDAYNLTSLKTIIPLSGFDLKRIKSPLQIRFSKENEEFRGIGMPKPIKLKNNMLVLADTHQVLCIYPYRDADATKISEETKEVIIVGYGAPGIDEQRLRNAVETTLEFIESVAGGEKEAIKVFKP